MQKPDDAVWLHSLLSDRPPASETVLATSQSNQTTNLRTVPFTEQVKMTQVLQESSNYDESHNPALPDKKKPWCLNCRLHTDWYSVYEGRAADKKHKVLRCKVCDGPTYWLVNPKTFNLASIATVIFCFIVGSALATNGFGLAGGPAAEDEFLTGLFCFPFGIFAACMLHSRSKGVRKKWEEFDKWVAEQSEG